MHTLPPNPAFRPLTDVQFARLKNQHHDVPLSPADCVTCQGEKRFRWYAQGSRSEVVDYECPCDQQWLLHLWLLYAGIGINYQRLGWDDASNVPPAAKAAVHGYAQQAKARARVGLGLTLLGEMRGCIQADAEIVVNRAGIGRRMTMRDLVTRFNGGRTEGISSSGKRYVQPKAWDLSIPTYVQREVDGVVRLGRVVNAWCSGMKTTYTVTTSTGRQIRATDEHPFLTERGWLRLDELKVGDEVHVRGQQATTGRIVKPKYRRIHGLHAHPYANKYRYAAECPEHRLVVEAHLNGLDYQAFVARIRARDVDGLTFLDTAEFHVHHKDHDTFNNELSNLELLTVAEHHRQHAAEGKGDHVLYKIATEEVVSVELFGEEETYDIEVADDPHNFIVNGFVVHNTGKSLLAHLLLKQLLAEGFEGYFVTFQGMLDLYTDGWSSREDKAWFSARVANTGVLVIDDIGRDSKGRIEMAGPMVDHILRTRYERARPTIITTNKSLDELGQLYSLNALSLMAGRCKTVEFLGSDYRDADFERLDAELEDGITRPVMV